MLTRNSVSPLTHSELTANTDDNGEKNADITAASVEAGSSKPCSSQPHAQTMNEGSMGIWHGAGLMDRGRRDHLELIHRGWARRGNNKTKNKLVFIYKARNKSTHEVA